MFQMKIMDLKTPSVLIDIDRLEKNIRDMASLAREGGVNLRPHIKTHKCFEIGVKQRDAGISGITVSTLDEAYSFASLGFDDITYAVPLIPDKFDLVQQITEHTHLNVIVDHPSIVEKLDLFCKDNDFNLDVLVKVDCGYPRCGIDPNSQAAVNLVKKIHQGSSIEFKGILTHAGHSYTATNVSEIKTIAKQEQDIMIKFARTLRAESSELNPEVVSIGSTPTTQLADTFQEGITEIRPGNYVFFDYTQIALRTCKVTDCALTVLASVISRNPGRVIIDAGATTLSKDMGPTHIEPNVGYGKVIYDYNEGSIDTSIILDSLSQEHGKLISTGETELPYQHGEKIRIIPNHSCLTANLSRIYHVVKGDSVIDRWGIYRDRSG